jgi:hypothetical protein
MTNKKSKSNGKGKGNSKNNAATADPCGMTSKKDKGYGDGEVWLAFGVVVAG